MEDYSLPSNVDAEKVILGAVLLDSRAYVEAAEILKPDDFILDSSRRVFLRMGELLDRGCAVDIVTLSAELARHKEIEAVGGVAWLASLTEGLPRRPVIEDYVRIIKDKSTARRMMGIFSAGIARLADQSEESLSVGLQIDSQLEDVLSHSVPPTFESADQYLSVHFPTPESLLEKNAKSQGIETGFREFDRMTCGLQRGDLIIIAARPSMGKTSLAINIADHVAVNCEGIVAFNTLEMSTEWILRRAICSRGRIPFQKHRSGDIDTNSSLNTDFADAYHELRRSKLLLDDKPKNVLEVATEWRSLMRRMPFDLGIIDHLTLFQHEETSRRQRNEAQLVGLDCFILKTPAKELNVPIILLCQLNRELTKRADKRPTLADLRESGRIEETADVVSFVHREGYYEPKDDSLRDKAEWIIAKQRNGPIGTIDLTWEPEFVRFSDPITASDLQMQEYLNWA